jgi:IS30 family transposase
MARLVLESKKRLFWEFICEGLLAGDAGEAAGVSATCGRRWFREAGGVKPDASKPNSSSSRPRLTLEDRIEIQAGIYANESLRAIGQRLGRPASTIKREIDANTELRTRKNPKRSGYRRKHAFGARQSGNTATVDYRAMSAHDRSADRARRPKLSKLSKLSKLAENDTLHREVQSRLELFHSPEQVALRLRVDFPDDPEMWVSHEAIYQAIYVQGRGRCAACAPSGPFVDRNVSPGPGRAESRTWSTSANARPRSLTGQCPDIGRATSSCAAPRRTRRSAP